MEKIKLNRMKNLQKELKKAAASYYNTGVELMSNKEYDAKFDELAGLEQEAGITDGFTSKVGFESSKKLSKVTHVYEAKSLGKTKDIEELIAAQANYPKKPYVCVSWKCDGSTVQLTYKNGQLANAATRGDGKTGQDITENVKYVDGIPQTIPYQDELVVRGEALMTYKEFDRLNVDGEFANPRNLANATITVQDKEILKERKVEFKGFELVHSGNEKFMDEINSFSDRLDKLSEFGFGVVPHVKIPLEDLKSQIAEWSKESVIKAIGFPVDGIVVANDDCGFTKNLTGTEHHPHLMKGMAFKWQDETAETVLREIEWSPSRTGLLNPVAIFDTVNLCGTEVSRASLHNVSYVEAMKLKIGDRITVYKANMIIPQIDENLDKDKSGPNPTYGVSCPCCHNKAELRLNPKSGTVVMICPEEACPAKELGRLEHFVSKHGMNIDGLARNTLEVLLSSGLVKEPADLYTLKDHKAELITMEGFAEKGVNNLLNAIEKSKDCDFAHFMYAQGIPNFGRGQIKILQKFIEKTKSDTGLPYIYALRALREENTDFTQIQGIGDILADKLNAWIDKELMPDTETRVSRILSSVNFNNMTLASQQTLGKVSTGSAIAGKSFCITGSLNQFANRDACVEFIEQNGGTFVSGVSKKTDYLVNNDIASTSGKNKKAKDLGIPVITEQMLVDAANGASLPGKTPVRNKGDEERV